MSTATIDLPLDAADFGFRELGTFSNDQITESRIYAGDGHSFAARRRQMKEARKRQYEANLAEVARLYSRVLKGDRYATLQFQEALSTSDFANLFGDVIDRVLLAKYVSQPVQWSQYARRGTVRDFRSVNRFTLDGGEAVLSAVPQLSNYPAASLTDGKYSYSVTKYGRRIALSWEDLINDDLDAFRSIPDRLGNAARRSEEKFVAGLYAASTGPNGTFFSSGNKNIVTTGTLNPALSITALQSAFTVLASQVDTDGAPIYIDGVVLVVPPALTVTANNILSATNILTAAGSGGASSDAGRPDQLWAVNWMSQKVKLVTNPWLPIVSTTNGNTSWYLFADPGVGRPALEIGFLAGHEQPELFAKAPNATRVGGGGVMPEDGDFESDSVEWRIRHVFGGTTLDPKGAFGSAGTNS